MKNLTNTFKAFVPFLTGAMAQEASRTSFDFIKSKKSILREMQFCRKENNLVGIYSSVLGNGMFLVGVERIVHADDGGALIIFHDEDMSGQVLSRRTIHIDEIERIVPFNNPYVRPSATLQPVLVKSA